MKKIFIFLFFVLFFSYASHVNAATITVCLQGGCDYSSVGGIQEAVEKAKDGDTILIQAGNYKSTDPIVVDPNYKYQNCLVDTKGKKITIKGVGGVTLDNANGNLDNQPGWSTGICVLGGEVTIDSITIHQTLRPAIYIQNARAIVKNVTFIDIDNTSVEVHQSQAMFLNNLFAGSAGYGISVGDTSYARIENNTFKGGGVSLDTCNNSAATGDISKNIITQSNVVVTCPNETQKLANIKVSNNFVFKGVTTGDPSCISPDNGVGDCGAGEICTGTVFAWPEFNGADEKGTVCVWGEGFIQGDFNIKATSPAAQGGAGFGYGPCANAGAAGCATYIQNNPLPAPPEPPEPPPGPGPGPGPNPGPNPGPQGSILPQIINPYNLPEVFGRLINLPNNISLSGERTTKALSQGTGMDLMLYIMFSVTYIMFMHLAIGMGSEFALGLMVTFFVFGGILGGWFHAYEGGFVVAAILSLMFIGAPKKEM